MVARITSSKAPAGVPGCVGLRVIIEHVATFNLRSDKANIVMLERDAKIQGGQKIKLCIQVPDVTTSEHGARAPRVEVAVGGGAKT